jgi:uncharacterized membrane protein YphA (DoxX/SURF4 family)
MLVLLRVSIGWHFLYAGIDKYTSGSFTSAGFLGQAKGPWAEDFYALIPDWNGSQRLDAKTQVDEMKEYAADFKKAYSLTGDQTAEVDKILTRRSVQLQAYFDDNKAGDEGMEEFRHQWTRLEGWKKQADHDMPFQQKRIWDQQTKLRGQLSRWSTEIEKIQLEFHEDLDDVLTQEQQAKTPARPIGSYFTQDNVIMYSNLVIGGCLIAGLFTRLACLGGGLFLLSVVMAQPDWPGLYPPPPPAAGRTLVVNKEFIEMMALFALATTRVGQWGGLDFIIHSLFVRPVWRKEGT